ncbi:hypothetical protein KY289_019780 [Solanum tuberosum]|nr:hypothetical protein KY289_019780 [Solanum tuberosum]
MVVSDESQKVTAGSYSGGDLSIPTALYAGNNQQSFYKQKNDYTLQCEVCKIKGHTKETCYRVIGYPPDYKFKRKFGPPARFGNNENGNRMAHVNVVEENGLGPAVPVFTQEQYGQILRLLKKENTNIPAVNQAGINTLFSIEIKIKQWVVDSGATKHTTTSLDELFDIIALEQGDHTQVQLPNGTITSISHTGSYNWGNGDVLTNVLDLSTGKVKGIGKETGGLYFMLNKGVGDGSRLNKVMAAKVEVVVAQLMHFKTTKDETVL